MAVKTPETREKQDNAYNPAHLHAAEQFSGSQTPDLQEKSPESEQQVDNDTRSAVEDQEKASTSQNSINYTGTGSGLPQKQSFQGKVFGKIKKNSALTAIIGVLLTAGFGLSLMTPGYLLVQFKETLSDKFNDQLTAMDMRTTAILKKKLGKTTTRGVCGANISIRCKYRTIGDRHVQRLERAGFTIEGDKDIFGRTKPSSFTLDGKIISADQMLNEATRDPQLRSALRHGYNPKFAAFSDAVATRLNSSLGIRKSKNITPSTDRDKMTEQLTQNASGEAGTEGGRPRTENVNGETQYFDGDGNRIGEEEFNRINGALDEIEARSQIADGVKKTALKSGLKSSVTAFALGTGVPDVFCTAWVTMRVASQAAKIFGARQLIRYSYQFMNTADAIKAGDADPEEVAYMSEILTSINSEGRSATDSVGYRYAAYGDTFNAGKFNGSVEDDELTDQAVDENTLQNEAAKYVNGQIIPDNMVANIISKVGASDSKTADQICEVVKSWQGQTIIFTAAIAGAVVAFFSGGLSVGAGTAAQIAATATLSVALAVIVPKLMDMAKGELITGNENGNEAGNAITSGQGGYNAQLSQARGLAVLEKDDAVDYAQATQRTIADYSEVERSELSPFDPNSKNTFIGGIVNSLLPYTAKLTNPGSALTSATSLLSGSLGKLLTPSIQAAEIKREELDQCSDVDYRGLAADPFCNLRYGLSWEALNTDAEDVLSYMEDNGYLERDSTDGKPGGPNGSVYQEYIAQCIERQTSIGDTLTEGSEGSGENCIQGRSGANEKRNTMFRLSYLDNSIQEGMDAELASGNASSGGDIVHAASFNVLGASHDSGSTANYKERMKKSVEGINAEDFDVIGFQEFETPQRVEFNKSLGSVYKLSEQNSRNDNGNAIGWKSDKYTLLAHGTMPGLVYTTGGKLKAPWVLLQDKNTKNEFYVLNTHDPANVHDNPPTKNVARRTANAEAHKKFIEGKLSIGKSVIMTGDFNSAYDIRDGDRDLGITPGNASTKLPYCIMTSSNLIHNAFDLYKNRDKKCPSSNVNWQEEQPGKGCTTQVDQIYVASPDDSIQISEFGCLLRGAGVGNAGNGSDHDTVKAKVSVPSASTTSDGSESNTPGRFFVGRAGFSGGSCVDYVKHILLKHNTRYKGESHGNGKDFAASLARAYGYRLDNKPAVHAIVSWGPDRGGGYGHVAIVAQVKADGSIVVEESNWSNPRQYGTHVVSKEEAATLQYAHAEVDWRD